MFVTGDEVWHANISIIYSTKAHSPLISSTIFPFPVFLKAKNEIVAHVQSIWNGWTRPQITPGPRISPSPSNQYPKHFLSPGLFTQPFFSTNVTSLRVVIRPAITWAHRASGMGGHHPVKDPVQESSPSPSPSPSNWYPHRYNHEPAKWIDGPLILQAFNDGQKSSDQADKRVAKRPKMEVSRCVNNPPNSRAPSISFYRILRNTCISG